MTPLDPELKEVIIDLQHGRVTEEGFRILFQRYRRHVLRFLQKKGLTEDDAKELAQDVFVSVYKGISQLRDVDHFEGWIFTLATNAYLNHLAQIGAQKRSAFRNAITTIEKDGRLLDAIDAVESPDKDPLAELIDREKVDLLRGEMMKLPQQMRTCVMMRVIDEASIEDIARKHGLSVNTVKSHLTRARQLLRERLEVEFGTLDFNESGES